VSDRTASPSPWLHRFAIALACATLGLVFAGGLVTSKGAGLAVPDWPLSYGTLMPEGWFRAENVRAEHSHRMIAGTIGIAMLILAIWIWRAEPRRWVRFLALAALMTVVTQAILGGITVLKLLPTSVSVSHALLGQTFFCLTVTLAVVTSPSWRRVAPALEPGPGIALRYLCIFFVAAVFLQLFLGAVMRHTDSGLAIYTFPLAHGHVIPKTDPVSLHNLNVDRIYKTDGEWRLGLEAVTAWQVWIHFAHRAWAIAVSAIALWVGVRIFRRYNASAALFFPALFVWILLVFQIILGALTVLSYKNPHITTAHVATGALILGLGVLMTLQSIRLVPRRTAPAATAARRASSTSPAPTREFAS
jgi:heme a synthase